ncbi:hypothetical protein KP509_34G053600 [Ceratopteris richardii]|uniref:Oleosin n=1 Tax=Ceratopteris richardii TaxID=49495 RepID=A0A8T2QKG7_CERRI|nr:hypothetical protein KP509_34G053600 [Ceratopteris richardii]
MAQQAREQARQMGGQAREQAHGIMYQLKRPGAVGWLGILAAAGALATVVTISLVVLSPVLLFFSPILIPLGIFLAVCTAGLLTVGGVLTGIVAAVSWVYKYYKGRHPPGSEQVDYAMRQLQETAEQVKHKARDFGGQIQTKAQEAAPGA